MEPIDIGNAEHYTWGGNCDGWHLLKSAGLSVIQERVPPGGAETAHYHRHAYQFFYVLAGTATLEIGDRRVTLQAGQGIPVPPNQPHRLVNEADADLSFLVVSAPMAHGDRVPV
jgi:mannose-6-phosphate isomerase-like protein (cupin superfamily)